MIFRVHLRSDSPDWWRYNVYLTLRGYDGSGREERHASSVGHLLDIWGAEGRSGPPPEWRVGEGLELSCEGSDHAAVWVYAIANTLPDGGRVAQIPDFEAVLTAWCDDREIFRKSFAVNPWGGLSVVGLELK